MIIRLFHHTMHIASKQLGYFVIILLMIMGLLTATAYWVAASINDRKDQVASWVSEKLDYPVTIGEIGLDWFGLLPKLEINTITVFNQEQGEEILNLQHLYLGLDVIDSLKNGKAVLNDIGLSGLDLTVIHDQHGQFLLQGLSTDPQQKPIEIDWTVWIQYLKKLNLESFMFNYINHKDPALSGVYSLESALLEQDDDGWLTEIKLNPPTTLAQKIHVNAHGKSSLELIYSNDWQWQTNIEGLQLNSIKKQLAWQGVDIDSGHLNAAISGFAYGDQIKSANIDLVLVDSQLVASDPNITAEPVVIDHLSGQLIWQQDDSWQLSGHDLQITLSGEQWPQTDFTIKQQLDESIIVASNYIRLSDLTAIALLSTATPEAIRQHQPAGDISGFSLHYSPDEGVQSLGFDMHELALSPWQDIPGVTGLTAIVHWQDSEGEISFNSRQLGLYPNALLKDPLFFDSVSGTLKLQQQDALWQFDSHEFKLWNSDLNLQLDGHIDHDETGKTNLDIKLNIADLIVNRWQSYIPIQLLDKDFQEWVKDAFTAGIITTGHIHLQGDVDDFLKGDPTSTKSQFDLVLNIEDGGLHYGSDWPDLENVTAVITGTGNDLVIKSQYGKIGGFDFVDVTTSITNLIKKGPILLTDGNIKGLTSDVIIFLQNSPLKERFAKAVKTVKASGNSKIALHLRVPITDLYASTVTGDLSFINSQAYDEIMPEIILSKVNGKLNFTEQSVDAKGIKGTLFDNPITIDVEPDNDKTAVILSGKVSSKTIDTLWSNTIPTYISGQTNYQIKALIAEKKIGEFSVDLELKSNLKGINIAMPEPFGKRQDQISNLSLNYINDDPAVYRLHYADKFNLVAADDKKEWRGELRFGKGQATLPKAGLKINGQLATVDIDEWKNWQASYLSDQQDTSLFDHIDFVSMNIDTLSAYQNQLDDLAFSAERGGQDWKISLNAKQAKGDIYLPHDLNSTAAVKLDFNYLHLKLPEQKQEIERNTVKQILWPSIVANIADLQIDDLVLGQLALTSSRQQSRWLLEEATLTSPEFIIQADGYWQQNTTIDKSHFNLHFNSGNLEQALGQLGYKEAMSAEDIAIDMTLDWPQSPIDFAKKEVDGTIDLLINRGALLGVDAGAAGRIFGMVSVASLPRHLSFGFGDLFTNKGFAFKSISGHFDVNKGIASTEDLIIKGESATIEITGITDTVKQQYDQKINIRPNVSSTLPVAGAVAAGPVGFGIGAAVLALDKVVSNVFGANVVNIFTYKYSLIGSWDAPTMALQESEESTTTEQKKGPIQR